MRKIFFLIAAVISALPFGAFGLVRCVPSSYVNPPSYCNTDKSDLSSNNFPGIAGNWTLEGCGGNGSPIWSIGGNFECADLIPDTDLCYCYITTFNDMYSLEQEVYFVVDLHGSYTCAYGTGSEGWCSMECADNAKDYFDQIRAKI